MDPVNMAVPRSKRTTYLVPDTYRRKATSKRWQRWLQDVAFAILDRLGCQAWDTREDYVVVQVEFDGIIDWAYEIMEQVHMLWHHSGQLYLLCGPEWYNRLINEGQGQTAWFNPVAFENPISNRWYNAGVGACKVLGMTVVFIPWMDGPPLVTPAFEDIMTYGGWK